MAVCTGSRSLRAGNRGFFGTRARRCAAGRLRRGGPAHAGAPWWRSRAFMSIAAAVVVVAVAAGRLHRAAPWRHRSAAGEAAR